MVLVIFGAGLVSHFGTARAATESRREELIEKKARREKGKLTADLQETYRNINASFKAGRKTHAEDDIAHMKDLLQNEGIPLSFRRQMARKLKDLEERYGLSDEAAVVPEPKPEDVEALSPEKAAQVKKLFAMEYQSDKIEQEQPKKKTKKTRGGRGERLQQEYQMKLDALYQEGVVFYEGKFYDLAEKVFRAIDRVQPGYKDVDQYLKNIPHDEK